MAGISLVFHFVAAIYHIWAAYYPYYYEHRMDYAKGFGGRMKFLTVWGHFLQVGYYVFAALVDIYNATRTSPCPKLKKARDWWFATLVFPVTFLVFILYWGLVLVNKELVMPKGAIPKMDPLYDHMVHTFIIGWALVEPLVTPIAVPKKRRGLQVLLLFAFVYTLWSYIVSLVVGRWPYPILNMLAGYQRLGFFAVLYVLMVCIFLSTRAYHKKFGRKEAVKTE